MKRYGMTLALTSALFSCTIDGSKCLPGLHDIGAPLCAKVCETQYDCAGVTVCVQLAEDDPLAVCVPECFSDTICDEGLYCRWWGSPRWYTHVCYPEEYRNE